MNLIKFKRYIKIKSKIWWLLAIIIILILVASELFLPKSFHAKFCEINIPEGANSEKIAELLTSKKLIKNKLFFKLYIKTFGIEKKLQSGIYVLSPTYSLWQICKMLEGQEEAKLLVKVTIPEGSKLTKIADLFAEKGLISKQQFLDFANFKAKVYFQNNYPFLKQNPETNIEGFLFPDTYLFTKGPTSPELIFEPMLKQFKNKIFSLWQNQPKTQNLNFYQTLILASIIEREAYLKEEMPYIASVFYNRLKNGYRLASCVTVFYALGDIDRTYLTYKDLKIDSKYNTYKYQGLPPTPIASPGIISFKAAMNPEKSDYLYFVAKGNGSHHFSKSFKEHEFYRKKYLKALRS